MLLNPELLTEATKTAVLARLAHVLTICARETYEVGTENVSDSRTLRAYNELLHRVIGAVVSPLSGSDGYSLESMVETVRSFGINYGRTREMEWALRLAFESVKTEPNANSSEHQS